jgi:uncharacterized protein
MALNNLHPHSELGDCVRLLVAAGADVNAMIATERDGCTALMCAVSRTCCTTPLQVLLNNGTDILVRSAKCSKTALRQGAQAGRTDNCKLLLAKEHSLVHMKENEGNSALVYAITRENVDTVQLLLQHGADINTVNNQRMTPLMEACIRNCVDVATSLIKKGADVNAVDSKGRTALIAAVNSYIYTYMNSTTTTQSWC